MQQLAMVHPAPESVPAPAPPEGVALRTFAAGDERAWADIINTVDLGGPIDVGGVRRTLTGLPCFDPQGLFLAHDAASGRPLATAAVWRPVDCGRMRQSLHMVAARPDAAGRGLGRLVCQAVVHYAGSRGRREMVLTTDDHRLPAIATYLRLGWLPRRYHRGEDHAERWRAVFAKLKGIDGAPAFAGFGRPVRVAVLGLRRGRHLIEAARGHPALHVVAGCDRDAPTLQRFAADFPEAVARENYDDLLRADADAVIVAHDCPDHAPAAIAALEAGRSVLSEVTACHTLAQAARLADAVEAAGGRYMLAENCLYSNPMMELRHLARSGALGQMRYAEGDYVHDCRYLMFPDRPAHWRNWLPPLHYTTHPLGPILRASGDRPARVVGMHTGAHMPGTAGGIDIGAMLVQTRSGAAVRVAAALAVHRKPASLWVCYYGTAGSIETDRWSDAVHHFDPNARHADGPATYRPTGRDHHAGETAGHLGADGRTMEVWLESVANGMASPIDVHEALDMTLPGLLAHRSGLTGSTPLDVPDLRDPAERQRCRDDHVRPDPNDPFRLLEEA